MLLSTSTFAFEDYDYYEESELEDIICSSDEECPSKQPLCKDNHCQFECDSIADCNGYPCIGGKCSRPSEFRSAVLHSSEDQFDYTNEYSEEDQPVGDRDEYLSEEEPDEDIIEYSAEGKADEDYLVEEKADEVINEYSTEDKEDGYADYYNYDEGSGYGDDYTNMTLIEMYQEETSTVKEDLDPDETSYEDEEYFDPKNIKDEYDEVVDNSTIKGFKKHLAFYFKSFNFCFGTCRSKYNTK